MSKGKAPTKSPAHEATLFVKLVAVGHGDAILLHWQPKTGISSTVLVDGGPEAGGTAIAAALKELGSSQIDLAVLTHCDADHIDGLVSYAKRSDRLPIERYWGPCIPAFRRHDWLFPPRVKRGLDMTESLERLLAGETNIIYPVEGAVWSSPDGDFVIRALSPAGKLIERLLVGDDTEDLFLSSPTPLGWLLHAPREADDEDAFDGLRTAIASGEIGREDLPAALPSVRPSILTGDFGDVARRHGLDPEFFGNNVLNDTSLVLLVDVRIGRVRRRLLLLGDLENFTYLMAVHPLGLGCDVVKVSHHGSSSHVESSRDAYDEVWQWLRPKAALVSANGKHGLPRLDFRDAALRYGATLYCTSQRTRNVLAGPREEACCHKFFSCGSAPQRSITLRMTENVFDSEGVPCATGALGGVIPIINIQQHTIEPSNILDRFTERELRLHVKWAVAELRRMHDQRRVVAGRSGLAAATLSDLARLAAAAGRHTAAVNIDMVVDRAVRQGKLWVTRRSRHGGGDRQAWILPSEAEWRELENWINGYTVIQLLVDSHGAAEVPSELLMAADTGFLARRVAQKFGFPEAMFAEAIWPRLVKNLINKNYDIGLRNFPSSDVRGVVVFPKGNLKETYEILIELFSCGGVDKYFRGIINHWRSAIPPYSEEADEISPFWRGEEGFSPELYEDVLRGYGTSGRWYDTELRSYVGGDNLFNFVQYIKGESKSIDGSVLRCALAASFVADLMMVPK